MVVIWLNRELYPRHYNDVIMSAMASHITSLAIVYSTLYTGADQRKHRSSALLAFARGIHRGQVNSPQKGPVTRKCFHLMTSSWWWQPIMYENIILPKEYVAWQTWVLSISCLLTYNQVNATPLKIEYALYEVTIANLYTTHKILHFVIVQLTSVWYTEQVHYCFPVFLR